MKDHCPVVWNYGDGTPIAHHKNVRLWNIQVPIDD